MELSRQTYTGQTDIVTPGAPVGATKLLWVSYINDNLGFLRGQLFPECLEDVGEVRNGDEAVTLSVKHSEGLPDLLLYVIVMDLSEDSRKNDKILRKEDYIEILC